MTQTFKVRHYKGVQHIELSPRGRLVVIAGGNGAGKSSFIDAITELFDPRGAKLTPKPIHEGADEARAEYVDDDLDLRITRVWKKNGGAGTLTVKALDGAQYSKPAEVVAKLTGGAIFDPVTWLSKEEKKQREELLAKVDLPFDLDELARQKKGAEDRRLEAGRELKRLQGALASMPAPASEVPDEEVSAQDILDRIAEAQDAQRHREEVQRRAVAAAGRVTALIEEIERLQAELVKAQASQRAADDAVAELPTVGHDIQGLRDQLAQVDEINRAVRVKQDRARIIAEHAEHQAAHDAAQADLDKIEHRKREGLAAAHFPVDGLSVDETGVTFNGVPFSQVNSAHRMRAAFGIATAGDPKLRLVIVRNGDLLDADSLQALANMAENRGYTVLVERDRDESRDIGFTITDGVLAEEGADR
jgi:ABC-type branched-subunit amino acid transport system ATPase component/uncharacterized small protein (DUF1192 family)